MTTSPPVHIVVLGTLDTKLEEFLYLRSQILEFDPSIVVTLIDAGRSETRHDAITVSQPEVYRRSGNDASTDAKAFSSLPRGEVIKAMTQGATAIVKELLSSSERKDASAPPYGVHGIVALGGSGGTSIASAVMRELPLTLPKLIVSTVAAGDTSSYVGESDIALMYSIVDVAGLNDVLRDVIANAAAAITGMAHAYAVRTSARREEEAAEGRKKKKSVGITMFGVTTPGVDAARRELEDRGFEVYVFHATGAGGRSMERLIREGRLDGVLDMTTTELADELLSGVMSAGEDRLRGAARAGVPQVVSVGALDMVNFGPRDTVPEKFAAPDSSRILFEHNPSVTVLRTTADESAELGRILTSRLREECARPDLIEVWLPLKGVSMIAVEGQPFFDKEADRALFSAVREGLDGSGVTVREKDADINDSAFAKDMAHRLVELIEAKGKS